jgi:chemotaxis response regulator CheB
MHEGDHTVKAAVQGRIVELPLVPSLRIVVVDDSCSFGDLAAALLEREPCIEVIGVARSGRDAMEMVARKKPDVVLMDVQMSPMSGLTAAALLSWLFSTRVVMMSSDDSPRLRAECTAAGAQAFIHKPSFISDFLIAVGPVARKVAHDRVTSREADVLAELTAV